MKLTRMLACLFSLTTLSAKADVAAWLAPELLREALEAPEGITLGNSFQVCVVTENGEAAVKLVGDQAAFSMRVGPGTVSGTFRLGSTGEARARLRVVRYGAVAESHTTMDFTGSGVHPFSFPAPALGADFQVRLEIMNECRNGGVTATLDRLYFQPSTTTVTLAEALDIAGLPEAAAVRLIASADEAVGVTGPPIAARGNDAVQQAMTGQGLAIEAVEPVL